VSGVWGTAVHGLAVQQVAGKPGRNRILDAEYGHLAPLRDFNCHGYCNAIQLRHISATNGASRRCEDGTPPASPPTRRHKQLHCGYRSKACAAALTRLAEHRGKNPAKRPAMLALYLQKARARGSKWTGSVLVKVARQQGDPPRSRVHSLARMIRSFCERTRSDQTPAGFFDLSASPRDCRGRPPQTLPRIGKAFQGQQNGFSAKLSATARPTAGGQWSSGRCSLVRGSGYERSFRSLSLTSLNDI